WRDDGLRLVHERPRARRLEAHCLEDAYDLPHDIDAMDVDRRAVTRLVAMLHDEPRAGALDDEHACVYRAMMRTAQRSEVLRIVRAAFRPRIDVVHIEEAVVPATGHDASVVVAPQDRATNGGWNPLRGASRGPRVGAFPEGFIDAAKLLGVAP